MPKTHKHAIHDADLGVIVEREWTTEKGIVQSFSIRVYDDKLGRQLIYESVCSNKKVTDRWTATEKVKEAFMTAYEAYPWKKREVFTKLKIWVEEFRKRYGHG